MVKSNLKKGIKCVVIGNNSRHNKAIGAVITINSPYNNQGYTSEEFGGTYFAYNDLSIYSPTKEHLIEKYDELKNQMLTIKEKISFLELSGKEKLESKDYKEYLLGKILDSPRGSREDKSRAILEIVESVDVNLSESPNTLNIINLPPVEDVDETMEKEEIEVETEDGGFDGHLPYDQ